MLDFDIWITSAVIIINSTTGIVGTGDPGAGGIFKGVGVAGIRADTLGNLLKNQLFSHC
jgi:hypothetical protein